MSFQYFFSIYFGWWAQKVSGLSRIRILISLKILNWIIVLEKFLDLLYTAAATRTSSFAINYISIKFLFSISYPQCIKRPPDWPNNFLTPVPFCGGNWIATDYGCLFEIFFGNFGIWKHKGVGYLCKPCLWISHSHHIKYIHIHTIYI